MKPRLEDKLVPGRPVVYKARGRWASVTWTTDPRGELVVAQANTNHRTWQSAMKRVQRWYYNGKTGTW